MTSAPETICGRCLSTDSRTFSSCRNQSRAPRENRSYHFAASAPALPPAPLVLGPTLGPESVLGAMATHVLLSGVTCNHVTHRLTLARATLSHSSALP